MEIKFENTEQCEFEQIESDRFIKKELVETEEKNIDFEDCLLSVEGKKDLLNCEVCNTNTLEAQRGRTLYDGDRIDLRQDLLRDKQFNMDLGYLDDFSLDNSLEKDDIIKQDDFTLDNLEDKFQDNQEFTQFRFKNDEVSYFVILSKFCDGEWEKLNETDREEAVTQLAAFNVEVLGIEKKPCIEFYIKEDQSEYGGYNDNLNLIRINKYNWDDSLEMADTISHEYRHVYQYERARKLETPLDRAFKDGLDNYIKPADDYQGYENQMVEVDAREYARIIKEKISYYNRV